MVTYTVKEMPMGERTGRKKWQVQKSGRRISTHRLKKAAKRRARREANMGDKIVVKDKRGRTVSGYPREKSCSR